MRILSIGLGLISLWAATASAVPATGRGPAQPASISTEIRSMRDSIGVWSTARRWAAVDSVASRLIELLESAPRPDSVQLSVALLDKANALWRIRRIRSGEAIASAERAAAVRERLERTGNAFSAGARLLASRIASQMVQHERSATLAADAVAWAERLTPPDSGIVVSGEHLVGMAQQALGRSDAARASFDRALAWLPERLLDTPQIVPLLSDRALLLSQLGEFDEAEVGLRRALELATRPGGESDLLENVLSRLSTLQLRMGNLAESVESASRSLAAARARAGAEQVATLFARVRLANRLDEFDDSRGALEERRDLLPALDAAIGPTHPTAINVRLGYAEDLMSVGERDSARVQLAMAREAMRSQPPARSGNPLLIRFLAAKLDRLNGESVRARDSLTVALAAEAGHSDGEGAAALLVEYFESLTHPADSVALKRAVAWVDSLADSSQVRQRVVWCELLTARTLAELRVGRVEASWPHALEAESLAHVRLVDEVRALPDSRGLQLMDRYSSMRDGMVASVGAPGTAEVAWDRLMSWRDLVRDEISRRRPVRGGAADTALAAAHERWAIQQRRVARLVVSGLAHSDDPASAARYAEARRAAEDAERQFARLSGVESSDAPAPGLPAVRASLHPGEVLVGFAVADRGDEQRELRAFVTRSGQEPVRFLSLGPVSAIESAIETWSSLLAVPPGASARAAESRCRRAGERVRDLVWSPIVRSIGEANLAYVVPVEPIADLPWLALPAPGGRYEAEEPLEIRVLTSERHVIGFARVAAAGSGLLAVGDPDFDRASAVRRLLPASDEGLRGPRPGVPCLGSMPRLAALPSARAEARDIATRWADSSGVRVLVGGDATEADFKRLAPGRSVLHLATHGVVVGDDCVGAGFVSARGLRGVGGVAPVARAAGATRSKSPARSAGAPAPVVSPWLGRRVWLALAGANGSAESPENEDDGLLTAEEVVTLDLRGTDWVVLSACQSGAAEDWAREGVLGMRRAFHLAGARSVIASRWPVADEATRVWMVALYEARPRVHSAGAAVREAAREVLRTRRARGQSTHPFYWAAFSSTGD